MSSDQTIDLRHLPMDQKMDYFSQGLGAILESLGFPACVLVMKVNDSSFVAARFPTCDDSCPDPMKCTAKIFDDAALDLRAQADIIRKGGTTKSGGGMLQ
jgi:hypothetical protein